MGFEQSDIPKGHTKLTPQATNPVPMLIAAPDGKILWAGDDFSRFSGYSAEQLTSNGGLMHVFEDQALLNNIFETLQKEGAWDGQAVLLDARNDEFFARVKAFPLQNGSGKKEIGFLFTDIAPSKKNAYLESRLLIAITQCTEILFSGEEPQVVVCRVLESIGRALHTHRAYIYSIENEDGLVAKRRYDWLSKSSLNNTHYQEFKSYRLADIGDLLAPLITGQDVTINRKSKLSPELLSAMEALQICTTLKIPIFKDNEIWGYMGFDDAEKVREWTGPEKKALRSLAHNIGAFIKINHLTEELLSKNRQLENAIESASDGLWVCDVRNNNLYISPRMYDIYGYQPGEWPMDMERIKEILKTEDTELLEHNIREVIKSRTPSYEFETVAKQKKGRYIWIKGNISFTYDEAGKVILHSGSVADISTEKTYELRIRRQEEHYQRLVNSLKEVVFETDKKGVISFLNNSWKNLTGLNNRDCTGKNLSEFIAPAYREVFANILQKLDEQLLPGRTEMQVIKNGQPYWTEVWMRGLYDSNFELTGISGSIFDINSKKIAEQQLRESEERYRLLSENTKDIICLHDRESRFLYISPSMQEMLGYTAKPLIGKEPWGCIHPDDINNLKEAFSQLLAGKEIGFTRYRVKHRRGHYMWVETVATHQEALKEGEETIQSATRDISLQKNAEEEIINALDKERQLVELRTNLINMISHEFRTPLTTIKSSSELLLKYLPSLKTSDIKDRFGIHFERIMAQVNRINELISGVLLLGRMDTGKIQFQPENLDFIEFINIFLQDYMEAHPEDKRLPELVIQGNPRPVMVDRLLVTHILRNLVSNALKYSQGKKNPELTIKFEKKLVSITIRDFGIGIPDNDRKNLFQSFFRGSNVLTIPGTGLGLVIVKQFVEMHGGVIDLKSELEQGTTIHVILPI